MQLAGSIQWVKSSTDHAGKRASGQFNGSRGQVVNSRGQETSSSERGPSEKGRQRTATPSAFIMQSKAAFIMQSKWARKALKVPRIG